jgi:hypothetical protein
MRGAIPPLLQYVFMAWCSVNHRDFTLPSSTPALLTAYLKFRGFLWSSQVTDRTVRLGNKWRRSPSKHINIHSSGSSVSFGTIRGCIQKFPDWVITKYTLTTINTIWETTKRVMAAKITRLTHKIAVQLYLVAQSCTIFSSRSRWPVLKLLDTPSYIPV